MPREVLTIEQLRAAIQRRIAASNDLKCRQCRTPGIYILWQSDEGECNWAPQGLVETGRCAGVVKRIIYEVQSLYNVRPLDSRPCPALHQTGAGRIAIPASADSPDGLSEQHIMHE
jgi:hypothetical protein